MAKHNQKSKTHIRKELNNQTIIVTKKIVSANDVVLPEKFQKLNYMLAETTFIN